ncbi:hypothetical protein JXA12_03850 [Candidatus Woesearchaeota archaeon]|nr:hypothetical protein [Candidatus Woesearchaeota archaeon]
MAYYVKIGNPREFRRDVLEASKKVIGCLQANRNVQFIRQRKLELMRGLQEQVKELSLLFSKLDDLFPDKELREEALQRLRQAEEERKQALRRALEEKRAQEAAARERAEDDAGYAEHPDMRDEVAWHADDAAADDDSEQESALPPPRSEADKLQSALASIEKKLASLQ